MCAYRDINSVRMPALVILILRERSVDHTGEQEEPGSIEVRFTLHQTPEMFRCIQKQFDMG